MSIGNPHDKNYAFRSFSATEVRIDLGWDDAVYQDIDPGGDTDLYLPVGKTQGPGEVMIRCNSTVTTEQLTINGAALRNSGNIVLNGQTGASECIRLEYFSNTDPDENGFWVASGAKYD